MTLTSLGNLLGFGPIELGPLAIPFTVFAAVGIINAMNMIDGIDGLAGGLALMVLIILLILAPAIGPTQVMMLTTIAALLPYMLCNLELPGCRQRKVFLGDAGSMLLGYLIVWALIDSTKSPGGIQPVTAIWLVAIPLSDTLAVMGRRMLQARHPFSADRGHLHHLLARIFHSTRKALVLMLVSAGLLAGLGLVGLILQVPEPVMFYSSMLIFTLYLIAVYATRRLYRRLCQRAQGLVPNRSAKRSN
jgi:UDP-GlcNAc:undecaprenyl-phosphate GlcNAc-1-phosphate transferase